jgi:hypothetical protein
MSRHSQFSQAVAERLQHYVYRLIDPRNGTTFYVGRGQGNRVFSHAAGQEKPSDSEEKEALKLKTIWAIKNSGFQVEHVIHRHGMGADVAIEVESALIDAYPGLTNVQSGQDSKRGVMHAEQVIQVYEAAEAKFEHKVILTNVNRTSDDEDPYDAVRYSWKIDPIKASACDYVLAVRKGLIVGAFKAEEWLPATAQNFPEFSLVDPNRTGPREGRYGFRGAPAPDEVNNLYVGKRVPDSKRKTGAANPIRYAGHNDSTQAK